VYEYQDGKRNAEEYCRRKRSRSLKIMRLFTMNKVDIGIINTAVGSFYQRFQKDEVGYERK
tara:strand:- start:186 stop:368 length:183 start_codon:yes stop_codon:yes gene_type:complete